MGGKLTKAKTEKKKIKKLFKEIDTDDNGSVSTEELGTGKYLSEALILASTNPQYDDKLFKELQVQYMKITSSEHVENVLRT